MNDVLGAERLFFVVYVFEITICDELNWQLVFVSDNCFAYLGYTNNPRKYELCRMLCLKMRKMR
jgi:hypothetical protein